MRKGSYNGSDTQKMANRTMTVASHFKFQNLERLNTIVGQVSETNNKQISMRSGKIGMSDKVLDLIKNRIKTNYDKLYENYDQNKKTILKQIHHVQTNISSENAISKGFQNVIKEKSTYDKAKIQFQAKQKKLKKLIEVRDQLKEGANQNNQFNEILSQKFSLINNLQSYKDVLDYQSAVLNNMKSDRRTIKLFLKEKYDKMLADQQFKKQRIKKLENINHNKRANLVRIQQALKKQEHCQIPQNLAEQLERKLQEYEGKHTYQNIVKHQNIISEQFRKQVQIEQARQRQEAKKLRLMKEKQDKKQYDLAYNFFLIKQQQEEKIKRICGVSSLSEIVNNSLESDSSNLQLIKAQIDSSIAQIRAQNQAINKQIDQILTRKDDFNQQNMLQAQEQLINQEKQHNSLVSNSVRKYELMNEWHRIIQMMSQKQVQKQKIGQTLKQILDQFSSKNNLQKSNKKVFALEQNQSINMQSSLKGKKGQERFQQESSIDAISIV